MHTFCAANLIISREAAKLWGLFLGRAPVIICKNGCPVWWSSRILSVALYVLTLAGLGVRWGLKGAGQRRVFLPPTMLKPVVAAPVMGRPARS